MLRRYLWLSLALPCVYVGTATLGFGYRQHCANGTLVKLRLPLLPAPASATRLLVFAPHCDDETLGCGGLIQQTLAAGGRVQVVILTNGDSFRTAVECKLHSLRVMPRDYIDFARSRQRESLQALAHLGVAARNVAFLGYPDQGMRALWNTYWTPDRLYLSPTTRCDHAPYATIFHKNTGYCGQHVLDDIKASLCAFQPTLVTVTHPAEDHGDHAFAAAFVTRALQEVQEEQAKENIEQREPEEQKGQKAQQEHDNATLHNKRWAAETRLKYYLIHRGDWPLPVSDARRTGECPLVPPLEMLHTDTRWTSRPLTDVQTRRKAQSIRLYSSQTSMMDPFLNAFARSTELYGEIGATRLAHIAANTDGNISANIVDVWRTLPPFLLDPVRDNVVRDLQGSGDIRALYACRDARFLYLRLDCCQPVSRRLTYTVHLRPFANGGATSTKACVIILRPACAGTVTAQGVRLVSQGRSLEAAIPWRLLTNTLQGGEGAITFLAISAETWAGGENGGVEIDKTGVRFLNTM